MNLRAIMKRAHELAKGMEGDYRARLSLALRIAWKEAKEGMEKELPQLLGSPKQVKWAEDIRSEVLRVLEKCRHVVETVKPEKFQGHIRKEYENARKWAESETMAVIFIDRFRYITSKKKSDRIKVENLKKGFGNKFFFNIACNYWYDGTGEG